MSVLEEKWMVITEIVPSFMTPNAKVTSVQHKIRRWIESGVLPARKASTEEIAYLIAAQRVRGIPPEGIYLVDEADIALIGIRLRSPGFPKGRTRPRKGKTTGAGTPEH